MSLRNTLTYMVCCLFCYLPCRAQTGADQELARDTIFVLTLDKLYQMILSTHPVARQVELLGEEAKQEVRLARGNFDPKIEATLDKKEFEGKEYYSIFNTELKVPLLVPVDPKIGFDRNKGEYLNPERYLSEENNYRQFYAGLSLPLGNGLLTDNRRTTLKQAEIFQRTTEAEQVKQINKLLLQAAKDYWEWFFSFNNYRIYTQNTTLAENILRQAQLSLEQGELAPVDTIQARLTLQQRRIEQQEALLKLQNSQIQLSSYLWDSLANPLELASFTIPVPDSLVQLNYETNLGELLAEAEANHPELQKLRLKQQHLELERRLAAEQLKPVVNLNYNFLSAPLNSSYELVMPSSEDYKLGVDVSFSLFLRKERAKLAMTKIKLNSLRFEASATEVAVRNEIRNAFNTLSTTISISGQQAQMVTMYQRLLDAELLNLENGESDLFKINIQQEKLIEAQSKLLKLRAESQKQYAALYWAAGIRRLGR